MEWVVVVVFSCNFVIKKCLSLSYSHENINDG